MVHLNTDYQPVNCPSHLIETTPKNLVASSMILSESLHLKNKHILWELNSSHPGLVLTEFLLLERQEFLVLMQQDSPAVTCHTVLYVYPMGPTPS